MSDGPMLVPDALLATPKADADAPRFGVIEGRKHENWDTLRCELDLGELSEYVDFVRALTVRLTEALPPEAQPICERFQERISHELSRWPDILDREKPLSDKNLRVRLGLMPPTMENLDLLEEFYECLVEVSGRPHVLPRGVKITEPPQVQELLASAKGPAIAEMREAFHAFRALLHKAVNLGVVTKRGPHLYYRNKFLGNGFTGAYRASEETNFLVQLKKAVRRVERGGVALKGILDKLQRQGWRVTGSSGDPDDTKGTETGEVHLERLRGKTYEVTSVPYKAAFTCGAPSVIMSRQATAREISQLGNGGTA